MHIIHSLEGFCYRGPFSVQCVKFSEGDGGGNEEEVGMRSVQRVSLGTLENISGIDVRVIEDKFSAKQM